MKYKLVLFAALLLNFACSEQVTRVGEAESKRINLLFDSVADLGDVQTSSMMEKWSRSCALCHVNGEGGAPMMGDTDAWSPRLMGGKVGLYVHTIEGFNRMPPLGYCMDCGDEDFAAMIEMMSGVNK